jgi:PAT family beta-lactamase induction signal transducer AmpG
VAPVGTALAALAVAFASASQDIAIDAYRIEVLEEDEQGPGSSATQIGARAGFLMSGAGAIALSDFLDWQAVFGFLAALVLVGSLGVFIAPEPARGPRARPGPGLLEALGDRLQEAVVAPFADFLRRRGWLLILAFVLLYKFGDAIGGVMANPFYVALGFTGVEIAGIVKVLGIAATLLGVLAGGALAVRFGLFPALFVGGVLQAATNLLFALQAAVGHDLAMLALAIGADSFTGGLGSAAFVAYLSSLCNVPFTGTQYALLTSFMAAGRTFLSSGGGWLADQTDWISFFVLTTLLALPGLVLLLFLMRLGRKTASLSTAAGS